MAVYKPSNCVPFLGALDLTQPQFFQCEINTSNLPVTAYKIRILDSANNIIFEGSQYSPIPSGNTGLNGSLLTVPVIVTNQASLTYNNIYYDGTSWYKKTSNTGTAQVSNFYNRYINQPYKWQITLAQGVGFDSSGPLLPSLIWYDMTVTTGQILGSVPNRIQGPYSENIYKDYYIQLCSSTYDRNASSDEQNQSFVGTRVLIDSYDNTYGYIYPDEGVFTQDQINQASYFQIYKETNNPEQVRASRMVDYATTQSLGDSRVKIGNTYYTAPLKASTTSTYWFDQTYSGINVNDANDFTPLVSFYDTGADANTAITLNTTRMLFKNETAGDTLNSSPYNGVFVLADIIFTPDSTGSDTGTLIVRWQRPSDSNSWGNFLDKIYFVNSGSSSGLNYQSNASAQGTINSTPLMFTVEEPVELYPNATTWINKNFGRVYKNSSTYTYIKPFAGIEQNMYIKYILNNTPNYLIINSIDTDAWVIGHESLSSPLSPGTFYSILSYFKTGDENPFYGYSLPTLQIEDSNGTAISPNEQYTVTNRYITVNGIYNQEQNKSWRNFQWVLTNLNLNTTVETEKTYNGSITATFEGLQSDNQYDLTLIIEDEMGIVTSTTVNFMVSVEVEDGKFPLTLSLDCNTQCVEVDFYKRGVIIPSEQSTSGVQYNDGNVQVSNVAPGNTIKERGYGVLYNEVELQGYTGETVVQSLGGPSGKNIILNSQHILNPYFEGGIYDTVISVDESGSVWTRVRIRLALPSNVIYDDDGNLIANPIRNQMVVYYWQEQSFDAGENWQIIDKTITQSEIVINKNGESQSTWRLSLNTQDNNIVFGLLSPDAVPNANYDYLITDVAYNIRINGQFLPGATQYRNLMGLNSNSGLILFPLSSSVIYNDYVQYGVQSSNGVVSFYSSDNNQFFVRAEGGNSTIWLDYNTVLATMLDLQVLNVVDLNSPVVWEDENNTWDDDSNFTATLYNPQNINSQSNYSGRQEIANYLLTFNIVVNNFDPALITVSTPLDIEGQCFMQLI